MTDLVKNSKIPVAPLWGFFTFIRKKTPVPLSIDQYVYFITALHSLDTQLDDVDDLLTFTKVFWLADPAWTKQYERYFLSFFKDISIPNPKPSPTPPDPPPPPEPLTPPKPSTPSEAPTPPEPVSSPVVTNESMVDFELVLRDAVGPSPVIIKDSAQSSTQYYLGDDLIMPFRMRTFIQRLRRKIETSERIQSDEINIREMITQYTRSGFIEELIYEMEDTSSSHIVLLSDRYGSMLAYEYLENYFADGFRRVPHCLFEHYSFYNLPERDSEGEYLLTDQGTHGDTFRTSEHHWSNKTWFFVLSDAGGLSGMVNRDRLKDSLKFWRFLNEISPHTHWINPVPMRYLNDCTAKRLQMSIPMIDPTEEALHMLILDSKSAR